MSWPKTFMPFLLSHESSQSQSLKGRALQSIMAGSAHMTPSTGSLLQQAQDSHDRCCAHVSPGLMARSAGSFHCTIVHCRMPPSTAGLSLMGWLKPAHSMLLQIKMEVMILMSGGTPNVCAQAQI